MPSKIEWTDETWNPVTGCSPEFQCWERCYARRMAKRLQANPRTAHKYRNGFKVTCHPEELDKPLHWRKPRMIFCCSMGDFFHPQVPLEFQARILNVMVKCPQHIFIILTKRHKQLAIFNEVCGWSAKSYPNIWLGVSVESQEQDHRIDELLKIPAKVIVVSYEPAIGSLILPPGFLERGKGSWCIVGGETGPGARPMNPEWARAVNKQCVAAGVPYFHKQNGMWRADRLADPASEEMYQFPDGMVMTPCTKKQAGRLLDGKEWNQIPGGTDD